MASQTRPTNEGDTSPESGLGSVLSALEGIATQLQTLGQRVADLEGGQRPQALPTIASRDERMRRLRPQLGEGVKTASVVNDLRYGQVPVEFPVDSVVRLRPSSELYQRIKARRPDIGEIVGIVTKIGPVMQATRLPKYIVQFPDFGKDGVGPQDLELAEAF